MAGPVEFVNKIHGGSKFLREILNKQIEHIFIDNDK